MILCSLPLQWVKGLPYVLISDIIVTREYHGKLLGNVLKVY